MTLNQYQISCKDSSIKCDPVAIVALTKESAWGKFVTQRFGALKPSKKDWKVKLVGTVSV